MISGKEAAQNKKEIQSDSQKRLREKHVSLPYHKPKQRTLKEFLEQRTRFAAALPIHSNTPSIAMKMSRQQLEIMSKNIEDREKEVEEFFKSDSESESEIEEIVAEEVTPIVTKDISQAIATEILNNIIDNIFGPIEEVLTEKEPVVSTDLMEEIFCPVIAIDSEEIEEDSNKVGEDSKADDVTVNDVTKLENQTKIDDVTIGNDRVESEMMDKEENTTKEDDSIELIFNLDDFDEDDEEEFPKTIISPTKESLEAEKLERLLNKFKDDDSKGLQNVDADQEVENMDTEENVKTKTPMQLLKDKLMNFKPILSGDPDHVINLDAEVAKPSGVAELMERFFKHTAKRTPHKNNISLSVVSVAGGEIIKEKVAIVADDNEEPEISEKPGTKIKKLRDELQLQMAQRRSELWKQKQGLIKEKNEEEAMFKGETSDCGVKDDDILDNDEEEELTDPESSEQEEDEIDDVQPEKIKRKSALIDDEAEESDVEETENVVAIDEDSDDDDGEADDEEDIEEVDVITPRKPLRRIIQAFEDSDEEEDNAGVNAIVAEIKTAELDSTDPWDDDDCPPPAQPRVYGTPIQTNRTQTKSDLGFVSPICTLTGLQSFNSGSKFYQDSPISPAIILEKETSPIRTNTAQKKLFSDMYQSQSDVDDLADLCSGKFPTQTQKPISPAVVQDKESSPVETTVAQNQLFNDMHQSQSNIDDLADICSGTFPTQTQIIEENKQLISDDIPMNTQDMLDICSGVFTGITQKPVAKPVQVEEISPTKEKRISILQNIILGGNEEMKHLGDDEEDKLISTLLDEEEMEKFKKKFVSPVITASQVSRTPEMSALAARIHFESSDEDESEERIQSSKKKNTQKIVDSDDSDDDMVDDDEEEIHLHDEEIDEDIGEENDENNDEVAYDSEENEIEFTTTKAAASARKLNAAAFFEEEAELSESEWGSADEDENDEDRLEVELGDAEKFDNDKVKSDLEKIHMRRILDDDSREVKILQEMLLQDGELHGAGRQRQFRWKNIDSMNEENEGPKDEDGVVILDEDDEKTEEEWRRKRHEREVFLRKQMENSQSLDDEGDVPIRANSQVLKLGQKAIIRSNSKNNTPIDKSKCSTSPDFKSSLFMMNKRGSFLSRKDEVLNRLAEYTKVSSSVMGLSKSSKKFVFQTVSPENEESAGADKKRKAPSDGTPLALKKLRLNTLSPAVTKKTDKPNRAKNLFVTNSW